MKTYVVVRHGSNAANQSMIQRMVLGFVEALDDCEAKEKANDHWTCYNNQYFEVIEESEVNVDDWNEANEILDNLYLENWLKKLF